MLFALSSTCENYKQKHIRVNSVLIFCRSLQFRTIIIIFMLLSHSCLFFIFLFFVGESSTNTSQYYMDSHIYITFTTAKFNEMFIASKFTHRALYARLDKYMVVHTHDSIVGGREVKNETIL